MDAQKFQKYSEYIYFFGGLILFALIILYGVSLFADWKAPIEKKNYAIEVSLPVLDLDRYRKLSKTDK